MNHLNKIINHYNVNETYSIYTDISQVPSSLKNSIVILSDLNDKLIKYMNSNSESNIFIFIVSNDFDFNLFVKNIQSSNINAYKYYKESEYIIVVDSDNNYL